jgi:hypothetical protein
MGKAWTRLVVAGAANAIADGARPVPASQRTTPAGTARRAAHPVTDDLLFTNLPSVAQ